MWISHQSGKTLRTTWSPASISQTGIPRGPCTNRQGTFPIARARREDKSPSFASGANCRIQCVAQLSIKTSSSSSTPDMKTFATDPVAAGAGDTSATRADRPGTAARAADKCGQSLFRCSPLQSQHSSFLRGDVSRPPLLFGSAWRGDAERDVDRARGLSHSPNMWVEAPQLKHRLVPWSTHG